MLFKINSYINRDIHSVYNFLTSLDKLPWHTHPVVKKYQKLTEGPVNVGTQYRETIVYGKRNIEIEFFVSRCNSPTFIEYKWKGQKMKGMLMYYLKPIDGKTMIILVQTLHLAWFLKPFNPFVYFLFQKRIKDRLRSIKFILENSLEGIKSFGELNALHLN